MTANLSDLMVDFSGLRMADGEAAPEKALELFRQSGCFVAKNLIDRTLLLNVQRYINGLIDLMYNRLGQARAAAPDHLGRFDDGFRQLNQINREYGGIVYRACRRLLPVHSLSVDPALCALSAQLMKTDLMVSCNLKAVRIDQPSEDKYLFGWHQDYPYIQDSQDGVVYWLPLHDVDEINGCLKVALASHHQGIRKVRVKDSENVNRNGAHTIELLDPNEHQRYVNLSVPLKFGDALVFSTLLLHASSANLSQQTRWTLQIRHGNFRDTLAIKLGWPGGMIEGEPFERHHSDLAVIEPSDPD